MLVQRHGRRRLQQLAIEGGEDAHVVIGASRGADDSGVLKILLINVPLDRYIQSHAKREWKSVDWTEFWNKPDRRPQETGR